MAKKKKKNTNNKHYIVLGAIALLIIAFLALIIFPNRDRYYECESFLDGQNIMNPVANNDRLKNYDYYRIYLNDDGTFELKYRLIDNKKESVEKGTYSFKSNKTKLVLYYTNPKQEMDNTATYTVDGDYLVRDEEVEFSLGGTFYYYTVKQKFKYK